MNESDVHAALVEADAYLAGLAALTEQNDGAVALPAFALLQLLRPARERVSAALHAIETGNEEGAVQVVVTGNGRAP